MRLAVYTDYTYRRDRDGVSGERAFVRFMTGLRPHVDRLVLLGRLDPSPGRSHYPIGEDVEFVGLPFYSSLMQPAKVISSLALALVRFWRALEEVDTVWLLGPYIHAIAFALLARARGRAVILGVRQDLPAYARSRHPGRRWVHVVADVLEWSFRMLARKLPVVVVGSDLARRYAHAPALLQLTVSLVSEADLVDPEDALERPPGTHPTLLSVGRLDEEKNPLLLAEALSLLRRSGGDWRMDIVGEGPMLAPLQARLAELSLDGFANLRGYVPIDGGLMQLYKAADVFLHVSWTEGLPQVLFEAFAAGTPVVATDVGGVAAAASGAALLIAPGDAAAAAAAVRRVYEERELRAELVRAAAQRVGEHTLEAEAARLAAFLRGEHGEAPAGGA